MILLNRLLKQFEQNNNKQAISGLYGLQCKLRGIHALKANFYLAQAYFAEGQKTSRLQTIPS
jgi:hypothetical protein